MKKALLLLVVVLLINTTQSTFACTVFSAFQGDSIVYAGNNEDNFWQQGLMRVYPAEEGLFGAITWGLDSFCIEGGMNEMGLFYDGNAVDGGTVTIDPNKTEFEWHHQREMLGKCSTVQEALDFLRQFNLSFLNEGQLYFADATGASAIIEGDEIIYQTGNYNISTNFYRSKIDPYSNKEEYWRYVAADSILNANTGNLSLDVMLEVCYETKQENIPVYANICDLKKKEMYVFQHADFDRPFVINLEEELAKGESISYIYDRYIEEHPDGYKYRGFWFSEGFGYAALIQYDEESGYEHVYLYEYTDVSMLMSGIFVIVDDYLVHPETEEPFAKLERLNGHQVKLSFDEKNFFIMNNLDLEKMGGYPYMETFIYNADTDPELNFEVFWHNFKDHCVLFGLTGVDWQAQYDKYRPMVNSETKDEKLYEILTSMVEPLKDGHTTISAVVDGSMVEYTGGIDRDTAMLVARFGDYTDVFYSKIDDLSSTPDESIIWGTINDNILYVNILNLDAGMGENAPEEEEIEFFNSVIDELLSGYEEAKGIILDFRWNSGGNPDMAVMLAEKFTDKKVLAFSEKFKINADNTLSEPLNVYTKAENSDFYKKPVVLLTSRHTASAAEQFVMTVKNPVFENFTILGDTTMGAFSDMLERTMPNGWTFTLSNKEVYDYEGKNYEQKGIAPDIVLLPDANELDKGEDNILNAAIEMFGTTDISETNLMLNANACVLQQNYPNPFNGNSKISYQLPKGTQQADLVIYDALGRKVRQFALQNQATGQVEIQRNDLQAGTYFYNMVVDGIKSETKKMIVSSL